MKINSRIMITAHTIINIGEKIFTVKPGFYRFFRTMATKTRARIVVALMKASMDVNELATAIREERSNVSHALKILLVCNIIWVKQDGRKRIYSLNTDTIAPLMKLVEKHANRHCKKCMAGRKCLS